MRTTGYTTVRGRRRLSAAILLAVASVVATAGCSSQSSGATLTAHTAGSPEVIDCPFDQPAARPDKLILACADLGAVVQGITWTSWGPDGAEGDGLEHDNTCDPNCATGNYITKQVHVVLSGLVQPGNVFTQATTVDGAGQQLVRPMTKR
ncbi:hypothetical protein [Nocardia sp. alder85J]|uniref:hypothetical protein n=1 Tax=Nocardia sp. alder85J TaxID=2862949 RepID=UPI001CD4BCD2|nr:hypothetical protein [Nocardia sp. alder85J]MCX4097642.1 hypothetical protein [Nocardia sp. alder85J]